MEGFGEVLRSQNCQEIGWPVLEAKKKGSLKQYSHLLLARTVWLGCRWHCCRSRHLWTPPRWVLKLLCPCVSPATCSVLGDPGRCRTPGCQGPGEGDSSLHCLPANFPTGSTSGGEAHVLPLRSLQEFNQLLLYSQQSYYLAGSLRHWLHITFI